MNIGAIISKAIVEGEAKPKLDELKKATKDIESIFLKDLLKQMRKSVGESVFGKGPGSDMYQDMFDQAIAESAAKSGSMGIASLLFKQLAPKVRAEVEARLKLGGQETKVVSASSPNPEAPAQSSAPATADDLLRKARLGYKASAAGAVEASPLRGAITNRFKNIDIRN